MITGAKTPNQLKSIFRGQLIEAEPLWKHTTFQIGGPADFWAVPQDLTALREIIKFSQEEAMPLFIFGRGSNILVRDEGLRGIAVSLSSPQFKQLTIMDETITAGAAVSVTSFVRDARRAGLSGCEFLAGIPGTLGGAVCMNAGGGRVESREYRVKSIGGLVEEVTVMDRDGKIQNLSKDELKFGYRTSNLENFIVLEVKLKLRKGDPQAIAQKISEALQQKKRTQELTVPSAGCVFKNPKGESRSSAELIEISGLKGRRVGSACVSRKHANFILNLGGALARDVLALIGEIQQKVYEDHGVKLELEIKVIG